MIIETTHFGEVKIDEEKILNFEAGIPGFEDVHKFGIINSEDPESPFKWIQAIGIPKLAFALIDPFAVKKDYDFELNDEHVKALNIENDSQIAVYSIVVIPEDTKKISMNLKAPIIINMSNKKAAQVVLDTDQYTVRHFILDELQKQEV